MLSLWGADTANYPSFTLLYNNNGILTKIDMKHHWATWVMGCDKLSLIKKVFGITEQEYFKKRNYLLEYKNTVVKPRYEKWLKGYYDRYNIIKPALNEELKKLDYNLIE